MTAKPQTVAAAAIAYARRGWRVMPLYEVQPSCVCACRDGANCAAPGKHPRISTPKGSAQHPATSDVNQVRAWWKQWPQANIGIWLDSSSLVVLDIDTGDGKDGYASLVGRDLPETLVCRTQSGGEHRYYEANPDKAYRNRANAFGKGADCWSGPHYVIVPPSRGMKGEYRWNDPASKIAPAPDWFADAQDKPIGHLPEVRFDYQSPWQVDRLKSALRCIPPDDRDIWVMVGYAIARAFNRSDEGCGIFDDWAKTTTRNNYNEKLTRRIYLTDSRNDAARKVTVASVFHLARQNGWQPPKWEPARGRLRDAPKELDTDVAAAFRLALHFGPRLMFIEGSGWYTNTENGRWSGPSRTSAMRYASELHKVIADEISEAVGSKADKHTLGKLASALIKSQAAPRIAAALSLAESFLQVPADALDADPMLFGCENGIIDLKAGQLFEHEPRLFITRYSDTPFETNAHSPEFDSFLGDIFNDDDDLIQFVQRLFGYCITGLTTEQILIILWGDGSNGKSTLLDLIAGVMGPYATTGAPGLLAKRHFDTHPTELADLHKKRLVINSETNETTRLDEARVKSLTDAKFKARHMREDFVEFEATHKNILTSNHKPRINGADAGIWRRVLLIPFLVKFAYPSEVMNLRPGEIRKERDKNKANHLLNSADVRKAVLAWLVQGCLEWQKQGLNPPPVVQAAVQTYRAESNTIGRFLQDACVLRTEAKVGAAKLHGSYVEWAIGNGEEPVGQKQFRALLEREGLEQRTLHGSRIWVGLGLAAG